MEKSRASEFRKTQIAHVFKKELRFMDESRMQRRYHSLEEMIQDNYGDSVSVIRTDSVPGGDINNAYRLRLSDGTCLFVKTNSVGNLNFFLTESGGLGALRSLNKVGVPEVLGTGTDEQRGISFLALEYIESSPRTPAYWEDFGRQLAALHRAECQNYAASESSGKSGSKFGFYEDNYIGATPQKNQPQKNWVDFYRECRLLPQITMAGKYLDLSVRKKADWLLEHLDLYMREPEFPSLLHGDLWSGNMMCGKGGVPWIIDPAAYVGDFEADLAMTQMFGSLPGRFYGAYNEVNPVDKTGYTQRRKLYDLYQLLNHLNLFGSMYLGSVVDIINMYAGA